MDHFEMVEKLRTKANVSYEEAKAALEASDWDILDALVLLESEGKVNSGEVKPEYTTQEKAETKSAYTAGSETKAGFSEGLSKMWAWIKKLFNLGNTNQFVIRRHNEELISMPITVMAILMIVFWPFSLIVLFVGLFLGARYSFRGPNINSNVNEVMDKAQNKAASVVEIHAEKNDENKVE
ncbi:MAG: DUF4342 domain-containing protein [Clostridia bacterium]|nr:DUF4342 domain-containing protein [Clostridia bacterium]